MKRRITSIAILLSLFFASTADGVIAPQYPIRYPESAFTRIKADITPDIIIDRILKPIPTSKPSIVVPESKPIIVDTKTPMSRITGAHKLVGKASWYCWPSYPSVCTNGYPYGGSYAAAGPKLREAICGNRDSKCYKGKTVYVNGIPVKLIDYCQCHWNTSIEKLIDLYHNVFVNTGSNVTITW